MTQTEETKIQTSVPWDDKASFPAFLGFNFTPTTHNDIYSRIDPSQTPLSQPSKVVLITGAGRGIGRSIAIQYAASNVATVIICARTGSQLDEVESTIHEYYPSVKVRKMILDVAKEDQILSLVKKISSEEGRLDVLVNNAGVSGAWNPLLEQDSKEYWNIWEVNYRGTYLMARAFLPLLISTANKEKSQVNIVNMSSIGAHNTTPGSSAYNITKFAIMRFSEFLHTEFAHQGINCFALHPGAVATELAKEIEQIQSVLVDTPDLAGGFVVWLTKEQRSWLSGRYLSVNWDVDELTAMKDEILQGDKLVMRMVV